MSSPHNVKNHINESPVDCVSYLVLEAWDGESKDLQEDLEFVVRQLAPPQTQHGFVQMLDDPEETDQ